MEILKTPGNIRVVEAIEADIRASTTRLQRENMIIGAKAGLRRAAGAALVILAMGLAIGAGFYGYAHLLDKRSSLELYNQTLAAQQQIAAELKDITLHVQGDVGMKPDAVINLAKDSVVGVTGVIKLADGQVVELKPGATIEVKPGGQISVTGVVKMADGASIKVNPPDMKGIIEKMQKSDGSGRPAPAFDNVTAFQSVGFGKGEVTTGWDYHADDDFAAPYRQFCYYIQSNNKGTIERKFDLAFDGRLRNDLRNPLHIDAREAFKSCTWHTS